MKNFRGIVISLALFVLSFSFVMAANYDSITTGCTGVTGTANLALDNPCNEAADVIGTPACPNNITPVISGTRVWYGQTSYGGCICTCNAGSSLNQIQTSAGLSNSSVPNIIGGIVKVALGLSGTIALIFVVWGGIMWIASKGEPGEIEKAKKLMINGAIGIAIIAGAYAITDFVIKQLGAAI